jgi:hypothetical protein
MRPQKEKLLDLWAPPFKVLRKANEYTCNRISYSACPLGDALCDALLFDSGKRKTQKRDKGRKAEESREELA